MFKRKVHKVYVTRSIKLINRTNAHTFARAHARASQVCRVKKIVKGELVSIRPQSIYYIDSWPAEQQNYGTANPFSFVYLLLL